MTQAYNLSQLANNLDSSGRLDATDGLVNAVPVANGGTGAANSTSARSNLGLGSMSTQNATAVAITGGSISGITDLAIADGGTGAGTAADARTNLSVPSTTGGGASGTWPINISGNAATATTAVTANNATNGLGVGQTYQNVTTSRAFNTDYTNSSGKPIFVWFLSGNSAGLMTAIGYVDGNMAAIGVSDTYNRVTISFIVPNGSTYRIGGTDITKTYWLELR